MIRQNALNLTVAYQTASSHCCIQPGTSLQVEDGGSWADPDAREKGTGLTKLLEPECGPARYQRHNPPVIRWPVGLRDGGLFYWGTKFEDSDQLTVAFHITSR